MTMALQCRDAYSRLLAGSIALTFFVYACVNAGMVMGLLPVVGVPLPLVNYGVAYRHGVAFGVGLQAIEASVGVGLGLFYLAREGFSFAMLRRMPEVTDVEMDEDGRVERIA